MLSYCSWLSECRMAFITEMHVFLIIFWCVLPSMRAQTLTLDINSGDVTFVQLGNTLELDVSYTYGGSDPIIVQWKFNNRNVAGKIGSGTATTSNPRTSIRGKATLVLRNTSFSDNGTYSVEISILGGAKKDRSFQVIIQERSTAVTNCSGTITLNEGDDLTCLCGHTGGNPPPTAVWSKDGSVLVTGYSKTYLVLKNVRNKNAGTYKCTVKSHNLQDDKTFKLVVQYKPTIKTFKREPTIGILGKGLKITCEAEGVPEPNYIIRHNGSILAGVTDGMKTIKSVQYSDAGSYTCNADNILGISTGSFNLRVEDEPITKPTTKSTTTKISPKSETSNMSDCTGFEWYIILVTLVCGIIVGMIFHYGITSLRRKFKSKKDVSKPAHNYDTPETHHEGAADNSTYQELELKNREPENSYQALRVNTRRRIDNETKIEDEAGYQELDKVREKDNNYQSLNRV